MDMKSWGEAAFVKYLSDHFPAPNDTLGIGDDCAQIPLDNDYVQLITADALVEGVHFLMEQIPPRDLGYKTIAVNVSDLAAMGGISQYAFLTVAIPSETDSIWLKELLQGINEACSQFNVSLIGGDTVGSKKDLFLSLTLIGKGLKGKIKYRHTALPGDRICICGRVGSSGAGFRSLQNSLEVTENVQELVLAHFRPQVFPEAGHWLAGFDSVHAMMDLSDGLDVDLRRILESSGCGAELEVDKLPLSNALMEVCRKQGWDAIQMALSGGEDYALVMTIAEENFKEIQEKFEKQFGFPLYCIGTVTDLTGNLSYLKQGQHIDLQLLPFDHFS